MKETGNKNFSINVNIQGNPLENLEVKYRETTDGVPFYECQINDKKVQLRKDEKWEQIWGDLSSEAINELGAAIDKAH